MQRVQEPVQEVQLHNSAVQDTVRHSQAVDLSPAQKHRSAEVDSPAFLAVVVVVVRPYQLWVAQAAYQAVGELHGLLGTSEAPERPEGDPASLGAWAWEEHLLGVETHQQWWVEEEVLSGKVRAGTQETVVAWVVLDIETE